MRRPGCKASSDDLAMASKTWFLPPDFTFLPEGQLALGTVLADPRRPTATPLATLGSAEHASIQLPEVRTIVERQRAFSGTRKRSFGLELFARFLELAGAETKSDVQWQKTLSLSAVDHEVRAYSGPFSPDALAAILAIDRVRRHVGSSRWAVRRRPVYIISAIRVARKSFAVVDETANDLSGSVSVSGPAAAATGVPVEVGGGVSGGRANTSSSSYETAPGIVFAYRLHVIRERGDDHPVAELFSDRTAFFTGGAEDEEDEGEDLEMESVPLTVNMLLQDLDLEPGGYEEQKLDDGDESFVVFGASV